MNIAKTNVTAQEAAQGERMIEVKLRFWTDPGKIQPKHAWSGGVVRIERNKSHGVVPGHPKVFHSLLDVGAVIEKVLIEHGIVLHPSQRMRKYIPVK